MLKFAFWPILFGLISTLRGLVFVDFTPFCTFMTSLDSTTNKYLARDQMV